jgi:nitroreductase
MDITEAIKLRRTIRRFKEEEIDTSSVERAERAKENFLSLIAKDVRIVNVSNKDNLKKVFKGALGDYGKLFNAPLYFAVITNRNYKDAPTNAGFIGEQFILELTKEGLSTCWIVPQSGSRMFDSRVELDSEEFVVAVIAAGYPADDFQSRLVNRIMGKTSGSRKKLSKLVYKDNLKTKARESEIKEAGLYEILNLARLSPSWHNVQPWSFLIKDGCLYLILSFDASRYKKRAAEERMHYHKIDMGIIMSGISLIRNKLGQETNWTILSDAETVDFQKELKVKSAKGIPFAFFKL